MSVRKTSIARTTSLTGAAVFGALAAVIAFLIQIPYPVPGFTFLQIDLAEIVDVLAFLLFGPAVGLLTTLIHYLVLNFLPTASPIFGPLLKLFGVTSMLLGMWLGYGTYTRILRRRGGLMTGFGIMLGTGAVLRAILLTPINYVFLIFVFAPNTAFSTSFLGFYFGGLAIYNVLQTLLAGIVPLLVVRALSRVAPNLEARTWFARLKLPMAKRNEGAPQP
jgi:riboflavin transporter FmnP